MSDVDRFTVYCEEDCQGQSLWAFCGYCGYLFNGTIPPDYCYDCNWLGYFVTCECGKLNKSPGQAYGWNNSFEKAYGHNKSSQKCNTCSGTGKITTRACKGSCTSSHRYCTHYTTTTLTSHSYCSHGKTSQHV